MFERLNMLVCKTQICFPRACHLQKCISQGFQNSTILFLWIKSTLFFSLFSSDDKKDQHIFFTSVFANSKNHHTLFRLISSKRRVSFKYLFAMPKHAYVFWELFTILVAFFTHKMFALLCRGEMLSCDKTQFTLKIEKFARMLKSLCITGNLYKGKGFALLC